MLLRLFSDQLNCMGNVSAFQKLPSELQKGVRFLLPMIFLYF